MKRQPGWRCSAAIALLAVLASPATPAAEYGVGTSFLNNGFLRSVNMLVPIRTEGYMIEPEGGLSTTKTSGTVTTKNDSYNVGSGFYKTRALGPQFEGYGGARLLYTRGKTDSGTGVTTKSNGWDAAPTLGVQYFFSKQFSLGLDAGLHYSDSKATTTTATTSTSSKVKAWNTEGRIMVRGYF